VIIDAHAHLGEDVVFDEAQDEKILIETYKENGIDGAIVQPFVPRPYLDDTRAIHDRIAKLCKDYPGKFWGMVSMNPHHRPDDVETEITRCIKQLGFVGIKITPIGHAVNPSSKDAFTIYEIAKILDVPVMIHTGAGTPFADPMSCEKAIRSFPSVKFILAHAGSNLMQTSAKFLAKLYDNTYLEPSWIPVINIKAMVDEIGASKIMFSSDMAENVPMELLKYRLAIKNKDDLETIFSKTAIDVFNLKF
jgi:predicted TIM-barrel fold metal-dependent hydrolase